MSGTFHQATSTEVQAMSRDSRPANAGQAGSHTHPQAPYFDRQSAPYRDDAKPAEPARCPDCGLSFHQGRWQHAAVSADASTAAVTCPACRRIRDGRPAGVVTLAGEFLQGHREEIVNLARHRAADAQAEHPLQRLIAVTGRDDGSLEITTTDAHLAHRIGEAVHSAYGGRVDRVDDDERQQTRVHWSR